ncbi:MAG: ROK family protein [Acidimicrobiales bacterium]
MSDHAAAPPAATRATRRPRAASPPPTRLDTLSVDVGGTGLKASVLSQSGAMEQDRVRMPTPYPLTPQKLIASIADLVRPLPPYDRISLGFPGMVRAGHVLSAPHFVSPKGPGGKATKALTRAWDNFDLQHALGVALAKPARVANDADIQGAAVVTGDGLEVVLTLGTGLGSALFYEGRLLPHLELAHHPFRKGKEYNDVVGEAARARMGNKRWNSRVADVVATVRALTFFDHCYIGGGNSTRVSADLPDDVSMVSNDAGILGGIKLWERTA